MSAAQANDGPTPAATDRPPPSPADVLRWRAWIGPVIAATLSGLFALYFIDWSWWGPDDGAYAFIASEILSGAAPHKDIQDIHPGYINFINAAALALFGEDILSLRWPIVLLTALQAALGYAVVERCAGRAAAVIGVFVLTATGAVQFFNPTPNWYALFLTIVLIWTLDQDRLPAARRELAAGFLIGLIFLFRQPTGVFVGAGALMVLMLQNGAKTKAHAPNLAAALLIGIAGVFAVYLVRSTNPASQLVFDAWPILALLSAALFVDTALARLATMLLRLTLGAAVSAAPLVVYHLVHGSLGVWLADVFVAPFTLIGLPFFDRVSYFYLPIAAVSYGAGAGSILHFIYWTLMLAAPIALGGVLLFSLLRGQTSRLSPLLIIAVFYGLVSAHYEIPIYLYYSTGLTFLALLALTHSKAAGGGVKAAAAFVGLVAAMFHAGQPASRSFAEIAAGEKAALIRSEIPRASIRITKTEKERYKALLGIIEACSTPTDRIFAYPTNAELYFLTGRKPPFRFFSTALGLAGEADVAQAAAIAMSSKGPALIVHNTADKYNAPVSDAFGERIRSRFEPFATVGEFEILANKSMIRPRSCLSAAGKLSR